MEQNYEICWGALPFSRVCVKLLHKADLKIPFKNEMREEKENPRFLPLCFKIPFPAVIFVPL